MVRLTRLQSWLTAAALVAGGMGIGPAMTHAADPVRAETESVSIASGITQPSQRLKLQFYSIGIVEELNVKDGDLVKKGDILARQDDYIEQKTLEALMVEANSVLTIEAQKIDQAAKKVVLDRKLELQKTKNATTSEVEEAQLEYDLAAKRVQLAEEAITGKKLEAQRQEKKVALMKLISPVDGIVEKINIGPGEVTDPQKSEGSIVVVRNDPLWVEIRTLSTSQVSRLHLGDSMQVRDDTRGAWQDAKIVFFAPVADAASDTRLIRLEMPNPANKETGLHVQVKLPQDVIDAEAHGADATAPTARAGQ